MPILRNTSQFLIDTSNISGSFAAGIVLGAPYSIWSATDSFYHNIMYDEDPDYGNVAGGLAGYATVVAIDTM